MTGTAETEAAEFHKIYKLDVTVIPTNRTLIRIENPDTRLPDRAREVQLHRAADRQPLHARPAGPGRHHLDREVGAALGAAGQDARFLRAARPNYLREVLVTPGIVPAEREKELETKLDADRGRQIVERPARLKELLRELGLELGEAAVRFMEVLEAGRIPHVVLNAKYHEREAEIVAQAGRLGAVTIATNMAGRGTDILLGGNPEFMARAELGPASRSSTTRVQVAGREDQPRDDAGGARRGGRRSAACSSSAPSATSPGASTTSCAAAPDARATRLPRASSSRSRTT